MTSVRLFLRLSTDIISVVGARYVLYLALMALTGLMEGISLASVIPLLVAVGVGTPEGEAGRWGELILSGIDWLGLQPTSISIGAVVLAALMLSTLLFLAQAYVGASLQTAYVHRWQKRLISAFFGAKWRFFLRRRQGDLLNALITETQRLGGGFYQTGLLLTGIIHSVIFFSIATALSGVITAFVLTGGAILFLATRSLIRRAYRIGTAIAKENAELQSLAGELISGAKLIKATATESDAIGILERTSGRLRQHFLSNAFDIQIVKGVFDFGAAAMVAGILVASQVVRSDPAVTLVILAIFVRLMPKLTGIQQSLQSLTVCLPTVELLQATADEAEAEAEVISSPPLPQQLRQGPLAVSLHGVHVQWDSLFALSGVSLEIPPGSCLALVGSSGAGKSTLVDVILGLAPVNQGEVRINGFPLETLCLASLRQRIGYMGQDTVLYNGSIRDNILWGKPMENDAALKEAARLAGVEQFISELSLGYEAPVGDRGSLLSGGERQRLGLARAVLGTPGLLILDEATSALDSETERLVMDALASLKGKVTIILIAHRLSSIWIADRICVLENGCIVEQGTRDELMRNQGRLHQLWRFQSTDQC